MECDYLEISERLVELASPLGDLSWSEVSSQKLIMLGAARRREEEYSLRALWNKCDAGVTLRSPQRNIRQI